MATSYPPFDKGRIYEFRYTFVAGASGWRESYRFSLSGIGSAMSELQAAYIVASALGEDRRYFLSQDVTISRITCKPLSQIDPATGFNVPITDIGVRQVPRGLGGVGPGALTPGLADVSTAVDVRMSSFAGWYNRTFQFRGIPQSLLQVSYNDTLPPIRAGVALDGIIRFVNDLGGLIAPPNGINGRYVLQGRSRDPLETLPAPITAITPGSGNCTTILTVTQLGQFPNYNVGDKVLITGVKGCGAVGLNGRTTVIATGPLGATTVSRRACCCPPWALRGGQVLKLVLRYYPLIGFKFTADAPVFGKIRRRSTGRQREFQRAKGRPKCI